MLRLLRKKLRNKFLSFLFPKAKLRASLCLPFLFFLQPRKVFRSAAESGGITRDGNNQTFVD
jgi:hypothetical protein